MKFTSRMPQDKRGFTTVVIEINGMPVLTIPLEDFMELAAVKYAWQIELRDVGHLGQARVIE